MDTKPTRSLNSLLADWSAAVSGTSFPQPPAYDGPDVALTGFVEHSGKVEPGQCFVARVRTGTDGHPYIANAISQGASLILGQREQATLNIELGDVPYLQVEDTAVAEAWLAAAWHRFPSRQLVVIGITGTDGKSTTANLLHSILRTAGIKAGMLSTIKAIIGQTEEPLALHVTTPEAPVVQAYLRRMVDAGLTHCILEATSHGLAQNRVGAVSFDLALITNVTHEHLDYHGDYETYFAAKAKLFEGLGIGDWGLGIGNPEKRMNRKVAILNEDDSSFERLANIPAPRRLTYAIDKPADIMASKIQHTAAKTNFTIHFPSAPAPLPPCPPAPPLTISSTLIGQFNIYNMLAAAAGAYALGVAPDSIKGGLEAVKGLNGRMERVDGGQDFPIIVDFAHTPNALEQALGAARQMTDGRVITIFGSAGKRDVAKRQLMAQIAAREADLAVLTAEDPRTESLDDILAMMAEGCSKAGGVEGVSFWRIPDRGRAIYFALFMARAGDIVLICGKGHEQSMCFGTSEYAWDDIHATRAALNAFLTGRPMVDLGLPTFTDDKRWTLDDS